MVEKKKRELFPPVNDVEIAMLDLTQNSSQISLLGAIKVVGPWVLLFAVLAHGLMKATAESYVLVLL